MRIGETKEYSMVVHTCSQNLIVLPKEQNDRLLWKPNNIIFPANTIPTNVFDQRTVMTFDSETGRKSWVTDDEGSLPLRNFMNNPFDITHTLSGGGLVTHSTITTVALIRWNERSPIMLSHIP